MSSRKTNSVMTPEEIAALFDEPAWATRFPPLLSFAQVAQLLQVPVQTVYGWSSQGLLDACKLFVGKHRRFNRNRLIQIIAENNLHGNY